MASHAPGGTRALVVITGPLESVPDDGTLSRLADLRAAADARVVLVSRPLESSSVHRSRLATLALALDATTVVAGNPTDWIDPFASEPDLSLVQAMDLVAALLAGEPLCSLKVTLRVRATPDEPFRSGELLRKQVGVSSNFCPFDCLEVPLVFAARIP